MSNIYNLYITFGTIPCLYSQVNIYYEKNPSYIWFRSGGHFDYNSNSVPENLKYYYHMCGSDKDYINNHYKDIVKRIKKIKENDSKAKFNIYTDDSRVQFFLKPIVLANVYNDINNIIIISEGNITEYLYRDIKMNDSEFQEKRWNELIKNISDEKYDDDILKISNYCFWLSTQKNVKFLLPYSELLENNSVSKKYKSTMNLIPLDIEDLYKKLPYEYKNNFTQNCSFKFEKKQKYIIILGTYDFGSKEYTALLYENLIDQMKYDYENNYKLLFKAHPLFPVSANKSFENYLHKSDIEFIPEKMPLETLLWENENIMIGGFCSSINSLIDCKRTKSFFGEKIGFVKLLAKKNMFEANEYNILLSQKLASNMLNLYYSEADNKMDLNKTISNLKNEQKIIIKENKELAKQINTLQDKIIQLENNLLRIILKKLKNKFNFKR